MNRALWAAMAVAAAVMVSPSISCASDEPTPQSLLAAWERVQREDPHTKVIERVSENHYHFRTDWFPYDGELIVLNTAIAPLSEGVDLPWGQMTIGTVEVDLPGLKKDQRESLQHGIGLWERSNTLHYDAASRRWLSMAEFRKQIMEISKREQAKWTGWGILSGSAVPIGLLLFMVFLWVSTSRRTKAIMAASRRNVQLSLDRQAEMIRLLERAVAALESKPGDRDAP